MKNKLIYFDADTDGKTKNALIKIANECTNFKKIEINLVKKILEIKIIGGKK